MSRSRWSDRRSIPANFFVKRESALPFRVLHDWVKGLESSRASPGRTLAQDIEGLRARLRGFVERPDVAEALYVASPDLVAGLPAWLSQPETPRGQKIERALIRYFLRMAGRATPFGLFASVSVGHVGQQTRLATPPSSTVRRHFRLDSQYLDSLCVQLEEDPDIRSALRLFPNNTLVAAGSVLRYVEAVHLGPLLSHRLVEVEVTQEVNAVLRAAADGRNLSELASELVADDLDFDEAYGFVTAMWQAQLLWSELRPQALDPDPVGRMLGLLRSIPAAAVARNALESAARQLDAIACSSLAIPPDQYSRVQQDLAQTLGSPRSKRVLQADLMGQQPGLSIGPEVIEELRVAMGILAHTSPSWQDPMLTRFSKRFTERYGNSEIPLLVAIDEEAGVGIEARTGLGDDPSPLLAGLGFSDRPSDALTRIGPNETALLRLLIPALQLGRREIVLDDAVVAALEGPAPRLPLPESYSVLATVFAQSDTLLTEGDFRVLCGGVAGPSGARMLGRFCDLDERLADEVRQYFESEGERAPGSILAEVAHLPATRVGNIASRVPLRTFQIPVLSRVAGGRQEIALQDIVVSITDGRVRLRSKTLGSEIIPRFTSALAFRSLGIPLFRFLCALQEQGINPGQMWHWGLLNSADFLPRVRYGKVVLSRAAWRIRSIDLGTADLDRPEELRSVFDRLRQSRSLPRWLLLQHDDLSLPIDLENLLSVRVLAHEIVSNSVVSVTELIPFDDDDVTRLWDGGATQELLVPFLAPKKDPPPIPAQVKRESPLHPRSFALGSEWLYLKLYGGTKSSDRLLVGPLADLVHHAMHSGWCDRWFFIRYSDPDWHVRVRFHGQPEVLRTVLLEALSRLIEEQRTGGVIWRAQYDSYEPEVERYGGPTGIGWSERLFSIDSSACLSLLPPLLSDSGRDRRWQVAARGVHDLLGAFDLSLPDRVRILLGGRRGLGWPSPEPEDWLKTLGRLHRRQRQSIEETISDGCLPEPEHQEVRGLLAERFRKLAELYEEPENPVRRADPLTRTQMILSFTHMFLNRILASSHLAQESLIYDLLSRTYQSSLARKG